MLSSPSWLIITWLMTFSYDSYSLPFLKAVSLVSLFKQHESKLIIHIQYAPCSTFNLPKNFLRQVLLLTPFGR